MQIRKRHGRPGIITVRVRDTEHITAYTSDRRRNYNSAKCLTVIECLSVNVRDTFRNRNIRQPEVTAAAVIRDFFNSVHERNAVQLGHTSKRKSADLFDRSRNHHVLQTAVKECTGADHSDTFRNPAPDRDIPAGFNCAHGNLCCAVQNLEFLCGFRYKHQLLR